MTKSALIVSPYLDHLGGGERYMLEAAAVIEQAGYKLTFAWDHKGQVTALAKQFDLDIFAISIAPEIKKLYFGGSPLAMWRATRRYDLVLYMSDGSIPLLGGKKNILHLQVPYHGVKGRSLTNKLKLSRIHAAIVNSQFTKRVVDIEYAIDSKVVYPPVTQVKTGKKQKIILSVGRFEPSLNVKRQDVLIEAFRELAPDLPGWRLILAGACSNKDWLNKLESRATGLPIEFVTDGSFKKIQQLYSKSRIYWHATGYGIDESEKPELTEHFGISVAESVLAGCVPLVIGKGGVGEIVPDIRYHWESIDQLVDLTKQVIAGKLTPPKLSKVLTAQTFANNINALC